MGYDLGLLDPVTNKPLHVSEKHHVHGGQYVLDGTTELSFHITYNYNKFLYEVLDGGIRSLYGKSGAESIPLLKTAISKLGNDVDDNYWAATEGNTKQALHGVLALAQMRPDGVWQGD